MLTNRREGNTHMITHIRVTAADRHYQLYAFSFTVRFLYDKSGQKHQKPDSPAHTQLCVCVSSQLVLIQEKLPDKNTARCGQREREKKKEEVSL